MKRLFPITVSAIMIVAIFKIDQALAQPDTTPERIDPKISYATYIGGANTELGNAVVVDAQGNTYVAGQTLSTSDVAYNGFQNTFGGGTSDGFVAKYNANGTRVWTSYLGGTGYFEHCNALALDPQGNIIVTGLTASSGLGTAGIFDVDYNGSDDAFVAKISPAGVRLWFTYLGGSASDVGMSLAVDSQGNIYCGGSTGSSTKIATTPGLDNTYGGSTRDAFLVKLSGNGQHIWSRYLGGESIDTGSKVVVDKDDNVVMSGSSMSTAGIAVNGFSNQRNGDEDAFLVKMAPTGVVLWGTYFGGGAGEKGYTLTVDQGNNLYLGGITYSSTGVAYRAAFSTFSGYYDTFIAKFNADGERKWATYFGGPGSDDITDLESDGNGYIYLSGNTRSTTNIAYKGFDNEYATGPYDNGFLAKFSASSGNRVWSSYYNGVDGQVSCKDIAITQKNRLFVTGVAESSDFPLNAFDNTLGGHTDSYLTRIDVAPKQHAVVQGYIFDDKNGNCIKDPEESPVVNVVVATEPERFFGMTDSTGYYSIAADTGTYAVRQLTSYATRLISQRCPVPPDGYNVHVENYGDSTALLNFADDITRCYVLDVNVSSSIRRRCFSSKTIVSYQNIGGAEAPDAKVYVELPQFVQLISASAAFTKDAAGRVVFNVGTLAPGQFGTIELKDSVICGNPSIRGLTQCTKAWITPFSDCYKPTPSWDKSDIYANVKCLNNDFAKVVLYNAGEGDMADSATFKLFLDDKLALAGNYKLPSNDSLVMRVPTDGRSVIVQAYQRPDHPRKTMVTASMEGCGQNEQGTISKGYIIQFVQDDEEPEKAVECLPIIDSFDPNDKLVLPVGTSEYKYTPTGTGLEYTIRFQNTGTAPALTVVVTDTLDSHLDPSTLRLEGASHANTMTLSGEEVAVVTWTFNDIELPSKDADEEGSHGFIKFSIRPLKTLADKTTVENDADIFFDFNEPIRTNTTLNTLHDVPAVVDDAVALDHSEVILSKPVIEGFSVGDTTAEGTQLVILGRGFDSTPEGNIVKFDGEPLTVLSASKTKLITLVHRELKSATVSETTLAGSDKKEFVVKAGKVNQQISFLPLPVLFANSAPTALVGSSSSMLPIRYTSSDTSIAVVDAGALVVKRPGVTVITAFQDGDDHFTPATPVQRMLHVNKIAQEIVFPALGTRYVEEDPFTPVATSTSGLAVEFASSNPAVAMVANNAIEIMGEGTTEIQATQPGNDFYAPAVPVSQTLTIGTILSVEVGAKSELILYPNPIMTNGYFSREGIVAGQSVIITIIDGTGRLVKQYEQEAADVMLLDASGLSPGVYLIKATQGRRTFGAKFSKK